MKNARNGGMNGEKMATRECDTTFPFGRMICE
jgi:hypothetical protein